MNRTCGACSAAVPDGVSLCTEDVDTLLRTLHSIPSVLEDATDTFARQDNMRGPGRQIGKTTEKPLPWNDHVPGKVDALTEALCRWARPVARSRGLVAIPVIPFTRDPKDPARVPGAVTLAELAARVLDDADALRRLVHGGDAFAEITDAVRACRQATDRPADRRYLGMCSTDTPLGLCERDLYAHPRRETVTCPSCAAEHNVKERRDQMLVAVYDEVVTYAEAERALPDLLQEAVKASTLRTWVSEGRLIPEGWRHAGVYSPVKIGYHDPPLLRIGDIVREYVRVAEAQAAKGAKKGKVGRKVA